MTARFCGPHHHNLRLCPTLPCVLLPFVSNSLSLLPALLPAERFFLIIKEMRRGLSLRAEVKGIGAVSGPLLMLIWALLGRMAARFAYYAASGPSPLREKRAAAKRKPRPPDPLALPRRKSWLIILVPETTHGAGHLRLFLAQPDVRALIAENPQIRRILRPLCRMLHIYIDPATFQPILPPFRKQPKTPLPIPYVTPPYPSPAAAAMHAAWIAKAGPRATRPPTIRPFHMKPRPPRPPNPVLA